MLARKARAKGQALLCRPCLLDNRHGLVANVCVTAATGTAEREAALSVAKFPHCAPQERADDK